MRTEGSFQFESQKWNRPCQAGWCRKREWKGFFFFFKSSILIGRKIRKHFARTASEKTSQKSVWMPQENSWLIIKSLAELLPEALSRLRAARQGRVTTVWGKRERAPGPETGPSLVLQLDLQRVSFFSICPILQILGWTAVLTPPNSMA